MRKTARHIVESVTMRNLPHAVSVVIKPSWRALLLPWDHNGMLTVSVARYERNKVAMVTFITCTCRFVVSPFHEVTIMILRVSHIVKYIIMLSVVHFVLNVRNPLQVN